MRYLASLFVVLITMSACGRSLEPRPPASSHVLTFAEFSAAAEATPSQPQCDDSCQAYRREFAYVVYVGKQIYCYWDDKKAATGTDFDALASGITARITTGISHNAYFDLLRDWASAFHDGHVNLLLGNDLSGVDVYSAPVRFELLAPGSDHEVLVVAAAKDVPGLNVGQIVVAIDDQPVDAVLTELAQHVSGSTSRMRRWAAARRLSDSSGSGLNALPLKLTVQSGSGTADYNVPRFAVLAAPADPSLPKPSPATGADAIKAVILPGNIGYLKVDGFHGSEEYFLLDEAMDRLSSTRALIVDVRANGGGDPGGDRILARLSDKRLVRYHTSISQSDFVLFHRPDIFLLPAYVAGQKFTNWFDVTVPQDGRTRYYDKPVAALTKPNCFSACDTFVAALRSNKLATIVGEGTGGGTGTPLVFELPVSAGISFRYSVARGRTSDDKPIEGVGTLPDLLVESTPHDVATGRDAPLAAAVSFLLSKTAPGSKPSTAAAAVAEAGQVYSKPFYTDLDLSPTQAETQELNRIAARDEQ